MEEKDKESIRTISVKIKDFSGDEFEELSEYIEFIIYKRRLNLLRSKESFSNLLKSNGFQDFESLVHHIKNKISFPRSGYDNMYGFEIRKWITQHFNVPDDQAREILKICEDMGLLHNSGLGNYR